MLEMCSNFILHQNNQLFVKNFMNEMEIALYSGTPRIGNFNVKVGHTP